MRPNPLKTAMIHSAVKKGVEDIREDPVRGIRNLIEILELFSKKTLQKDFAKSALSHLKNENSLYHKMSRQIVDGTNPELLVTLAINLGYNALSHGAGVIREMEEREGCIIPWCISIVLGDGLGRSSSDIERVVDEGKALGIYCYLLHADRGFSGMDRLLKTLWSKNDCAFLLFLHPEEIDIGFCSSILQAKNILPIIDLNCMDEGKKHAAGRLLADNGCLCGGFQNQARLIPQNIESKMLSEASALGLPFYFLLRDK